MPPSIPGGISCVLKSIGGVGGFRFFFGGMGGWKRTMGKSLWDTITTFLWFSNGSKDAKSDNTGKFTCLSLQKPSQTSSTYQCSILNVKLLDESFFFLATLSSLADSSFLTVVASCFPVSEFSSCFRLRPRGIFCFFLATFSMIADCGKSARKIRLKQYDSGSYWLLVKFVVLTNQGLGSINVSWSRCPQYSM